MHRLLLRGCALLILALVPLTWLHPLFAADHSSLYLPLILHSGRVPVAAAQAHWSAPIAVSPRDGAVWVVNPDTDSVTVLDAEALVPLAEVPVGQEPWALAIAPDGRRVYVLNRASGNLTIIDAATHQVTTTIAIGSEPGGIALSPSGRTAYITLTTADDVVVLDTERLTSTTRVAVAPRPYALAVSNDGDRSDRDEHVYVTHLLAIPRPGGAEATDDGRAGQVSVITADTSQHVQTIMLPPDAHGFPNLLTSITLANGRAWVPQTRAAPALPNRLTTTVFAAVSTLDLVAGMEDRAAYLPLNDQKIFGSPVNQPIAAIPAPDGDTLYVVLAGSNLVEAVDISDPHHPQLIGFVAAGQNPRGMAISADGQRGFVMSYLSRAVTVLDLTSVTVVDEVPVTGETLPPDVVQGKLLFNSGTNTRMARLPWVSCASCHPDGGTDGLTWMEPDGPRQTPHLWNSGQTGPWHWSATFDELQDVEDTIHQLQFGLGLAPGRDPLLLGAPNAGRTADLDALAAFMRHGTRAPTMPHPADETLATEGRRLFTAARCNTCHGGSAWTSSRLPGAAGTLDPDGNGMIDAALHDVGTLNAQDIRGATGFDVPTLLNVGYTAPYLHDGSAPTLEALLDSGHPDPNNAGNGLTDAEIAALITFLRTIDTDTPPIDTAP